MEILDTIRKTFPSLVFIFYHLLPLLSMSRFYHIMIDCFLSFNENSHFAQLYNDSESRVQDIYIKA